MDPITLKQPIFLCGMMGSGKSTVGKEVARELDVPFCDLDDLVEKEAGQSIPDIFEQKGEEEFRAIERRVLIRKSQYFKGVMALGGGSLQNQHIIDHLKIYGWLVFLDVPRSVILDRISGDPNRPMLPDDASATDNKIEKLLSERLSFYRQAEITIEAGKRPPKQIAHELVKKLTLYDGFNRR